jgi:N-succinyldiaminopimelate aminotransferase
VVDRSAAPLVLTPNPFYQIYEGAALLAGAEPYFLNTTADSGFLPELDAVPAEVWQRCQLFYLCTPGNPTGAVADVAYLQKLIKLADEHDFIIASDECYSELYFDEDAPPPGLLQAAAEMGRSDYRRCVVFHSLSKRSNLPGLRSGFVAGDAEVLGRFLKYRTYQGCALPPPTQAASIAAWNDEGHVKANRDLYRQKFEAVLKILQPVLKVERPDAGFYLWPETPISDTEFAQRLFAEQHVTVLPGSYLSRDAHGGNPGANRVRMALVAELDECIEAAERIREFVEKI